MASENGTREITIGDSHEYGPEPDIFSKDEIDTAILDYLRTFLRLPKPDISQRWHSICQASISAFRPIRS